jgi:methionyl-tRNA formyltransferase
MAVESITEKKLMPGELLILGKKMFIGTASNSIEIFRIVPAGKKEMNIADWINGARLIEGETFE